MKCDYCGIDCEEEFHPKMMEISRFFNCGFLFDPGGGCFNGVHNGDFISLRISTYCYKDDYNSMVEQLKEKYEIDWKNIKNGLQKL